MQEFMQFYIGGAWVDPAAPKPFDVINPATEEPAGRISLGGAADADKAVAAARKAFDEYSRTPVAERRALLQRIAAGYEARFDDFVTTITAEVGAPLWLSKAAQARMGVAHLQQMIKVLDGFAFDEDLDGTRIVREPVGVAALITPWNWPINQIMCKVAPALAAGCTMVLKPSEVAPLNACLLAQVLHEAGVPAGVFNLVNGDGPTVGAALASHPGVDMVSFTGSTRGGVAVAHAAADSVKRVHQELGGKSPNIILADADFKKAVAGGVTGCMLNSGQSCNAPTRMLVPQDRLAEVEGIAKAAAEKVVAGDPTAEGVTIGPVVSKAQFDKIQSLIQKGIDEGAELLTGGTGRPEGLARGYYVKPTVFSKVRNDMTIAREEIFGPVLAIIPYKDEDDAVRIANDTPYGLSAYVSGGDMARVRKVASQLRAGNVHLNGAGMDMNACFGGYKQSGNGREWGVFGLEEFLETKAVLGYAA